MKKLFTYLVMMALAFAAVGAVASDTNSLYNAGELTLGEQSLIQPGTHTLSDAEVSAVWYPFKHLGLEGALPLYYTDGTKLQSVAVGLQLRLPLLRYFALYVDGGTLYNWSATTFTEYVGGGVQERLPYLHRLQFQEGVRYNFSGITGLLGAAIKGPQAIVGVSFVF